MSEAAFTALQDLLGERFSRSISIRDEHGRDEGWHPGHAPEAVVFAHTTEEVSSIVKICAAHAVPVIAYGAGTSLEGQVLAVNGGVSLDMSAMSAILEINSEDMDCRVQAGVTRLQLNSDLRDTGLFFSVDPGADATLGGMAATRASGTNAVRYGTMADAVLGLTVVMADGRIVKTGTRARKSAAGYDLTHLMIGSEGTLGIITEVAVRLQAIPEAISAAVCAFPSVDDAVNSVILTIQSAIPVARVEFLDSFNMRAVNAHSGLSYREAPTLFFEFHGTPAGVAEQAAQVQEIVADFGAEDFQWATQTEDRTRLWDARHQAYFAAKHMAGARQSMPTDVCVPISQLAQVISETRKDIDACPLECGIIGHVGDGNFHTLIFFDGDDATERDCAQGLHDRMVERALSVSGTSTGEHGIGCGKIDFLAAETGEALSVMKSIKMALDPQGILNPGKLFRG